MSGLHRFQCLRTRSGNLRTRRIAFLLVSAAMYACFLTAASAQTADIQSSSTGMAWRPPVMDNEPFAHVLLDQLEGRASATGTQFKWDGEAWAGTDFNRFWVKSEGNIARSSMSDGDQEFLYDRPIPRMRYFDAQIGVRADLDSDPTRAWAAIGLEGLAPYEFEFAPTLYIRNDGRVAGRIEGAYSFRVRQRLVLEPQIELNFYSKDDKARKVGSGLSDLDGGIRLRYEINRKFAPYIGYVYSGSYGSSAAFTRATGDATHTSSFVFGVRVWR